RGQADGAAGDAGSQRAGIAEHVDVTIAPGRDRCQRRTAGKLVRSVQIGEHETIGGRLLDLGELPAIVQLDRGPRRGVRVAKDVEDVDAVPTVHVHFLIDYARRDAEVVGWLEEKHQH